MGTVPGPNPMAAILRAIQSNPALREELYRDPRGLITRLATRFPDEVDVRVVRDDDGHEYFQSSLSLDPENYARSRARMRRCPVAQMSAEELVADPVSALAPYGIRVPEDVIIDSDGRNLYMRVPLDESDKTG